MNCRNVLWCTVSLTVLALVVVSIGCGAVDEYNYYADVKETGLSTGQVTNVPEIMQQMRSANLKLVDSLIYMHGQNIMNNSVQMYELARALKQAQPAVAMQSPDDVGKFKKLADDLKYQTLVRNAYNHLVGEPIDTEGKSREEIHQEMHKALEGDGSLVGDEDYVKLSGDKALVGEVTTEAKRNAMARVASLPAIMALCYLGLIFYFRKQGGYKAVEIGPEGAGSA